MFDASLLSSAQTKLAAYRIKMQEPNGLVSEQAFGDSGSLSKAYSAVVGRHMTNRAFNDATATLSPSLLKPPPMPAMPGMPGDEEDDEDEEKQAQDLTTEQAFKTGFLLRCAQGGLDDAETLRLVKAARSTFSTVTRARALAPGAPGVLEKLARALAENVESPESREKQATTSSFPGLDQLVALISSGMSATGQAVSSLGPPAMLASLALPAGTGLLGGYALAKALKPSVEDPVAMAQQDEVISEYERLAGEARRRAALKRMEARTGTKLVSLAPSLG